MKNKILFLDIETDNIDTNIANLKFIGCYDGFNYHIFDNSDKSIISCKELLGKYDKIITFNGNNYDLPILERHGIKIEYWKHIDLYEVFKKRAVLLRSGGFKSYALKNIIKEIGIDDKKGEIDYKIFMKNEWTKDELEEIQTYLRKDLELTSKLWKFLLDKFDTLGEFVSDQDRKNYRHITSSSGAYAYKAICTHLGIKDEYADIEGNKPYKGAYIMTPTKESVRGKILYLDFASLYPMMYVHANLFSSKCKCCTKEEKWHGNDLFSIDGYYCRKKQGQVECMVKDLYSKRKGYKKSKDKREFAIKIILNSLYGISAKPSFIHLYDEFTASDCAKLSRQCIKYATSEFKSAGYDVIYCDTDSLFIHLKSDQSDIVAINFADKISERLSNKFPFPWKEFNLKLEDEIRYLQFFKDKSGKLKKKNYIYINKDDKITIKGLDIIKKNCSKLGQLIFNNYLKSEIIKNKDCKFDKKYIDSIINKIISDNKSILSKRFNIKDDEYKSKTSIYSAIKEMYGTGEMDLVKNYKIGAGKKVKYCNLNEIDNLGFRDFNLEDTYKELNVFIREVQNEL